MGDTNRILRLSTLLGLIPLFVWACSDENPSDDTSGSGGTGGSAPNTCPPTLVNYGSAPGILCENTGDTCADTEQMCECGQQTIEGNPWRCVPSSEGCPVELPAGGSSCSGSPASCDYVDAEERISCACQSQAWTCAPSRCPGIHPPQNGSACAGDAGLECSFFVAAFGNEPPSKAGNVICTCDDQEVWRCDD